LHPSYFLQRALGTLILLVAFFIIAEPSKRYELLMEATKDLGVVVFVSP